MLVGELVGLMDVNTVGSKADPSVEEMVDEMADYWVVMLDLLDSKMADKTAGVMVDSMVVSKADLKVVSKVDPLVLRGAVSTVASKAVLTAVKSDSSVVM